MPLSVHVQAQVLQLHAKLVMVMVVVMVWVMVMVVVMVWMMVTVALDVEPTLQSSC
jgi:hypothetical protein